MNIEPNMPSIVPLGLPPQISEEMGVSAPPPGTLYSLNFVQDQLDNESVVQQHSQQTPTLASPTPTLTPGMPVSILDLALIISDAIQTLQEMLNEAEMSDTEVSRDRTLSQLGGQEAANLTGLLGNTLAGNTNASAALNFTGTHLPQTAFNSDIPLDLASLIGRLESTYVPRHNNLLGALVFLNLSFPATTPLFQSALQFGSEAQPHINEERALYTNLGAEADKLRDATETYENALAEFNENKGEMSISERSETSLEINHLRSNMLSQRQEYNNHVNTHNSQVYEMNVERQASGLPPLPQEQQVYGGFTNPTPQLSREALSALHYSPVRDAVLSLGPLVMAAAEMVSTPLEAGLVIPFNGISPMREEMLSQGLKDRLGNAVVDRAMARARENGPYLSEDAYMDAVRQELGGVGRQGIFDEVRSEMPPNPLGSVTMLAHTMAGQATAHVGLVTSQNEAIGTLNNAISTFDPGSNELNDAVNTYNQQVGVHNEQAQTLNITRAQVGLPLIALQETMPPITESVALLEEIAMPPNPGALMLQHYAGVQDLAMSLVIGPLLADAAAFSTTTGFPIPLGALANLAEGIIMMATAAIALIALQNTGIESMNSSITRFGQALDDNEQIDSMNASLQGYMNGDVSESDYNQSADAYNAYAEGRNEGITEFNAAATLYNSQVDLNNLRTMSLNVGRALIGLPQLPLQQKIDLQPILPPLPQAPFEGDLQPLESLAALTAIDPFPEPPSVQDLLNAVYQPVQQAALSLVGLGVNNRLQDLAFAQATLLGFVYPQTFMESLSSIYFATPITTERSAISALAFGLGQTSLETSLGRGVLETISPAIPPQVLDGVQLLALQTLTQAAELAAMPAVLLLGSSFAGLQQNSPAISVALGISFMNRVQDFLVSGFLFSSVLEMVQGQTDLGPEEAASLAQTITNVVGFNMLMHGAARLSFSLGLPGLLPQIANQLFTPQSVQQTALEASTPTFSSVLQNPISLLYVKATIVNSLVMGQGLARPLAELQVNTAINQVLTSGIDINSQEEFHAGLVQAFSERGFDPELSLSLADQTIAFTQMEMMTPSLNMPFPVILNAVLVMAALSPLIGTLGVQEAGVEQALGNTQGNFENLREFALQFIVQMLLVGVSLNDAIILAVLAVDTLATGSVQQSDQPVAASTPGEVEAAETEVAEQAQGLEEQGENLLLPFPQTYSSIVVLAALTAPIALLGIQLGMAQQAFSLTEQSGNFTTIGDFALQLVFVSRLLGMGQNQAIALALLTIGFLATGQVGEVDQIEGAEAEPLSPNMNLAFPQDFQRTELMSVLTNPIVMLGVQVLLVNQALDQMQGQFTTMGDFALQFALGMCLLGVDRTASLTLALLAVNILSEQSTGETVEIDEAIAQNPLSNITSHMVLDAAVLRELFITQLLAMLTPELGMTRSTELANQAALALFGAVRGAEEDEDPVAALRALLQQLQALLAALQGGGEIPDLEGGLLGGLGEIFQPGADVAFLQEQMMQPGNTLLQVLLGGVNETNQNTDVRPPELQV